ncbi:hypothetical protein [Persicobacter psychrovividus]|uniref:Uncharacterized protein n=1 Tax=Persicobacter psychrovividus TaxID=387638 RepID=A0ABM7VK36_9BACT|nr:hypothetical protein PEPS_36360 [Persicobacter psychrovividus]
MDQVKNILDFKEIFNYGRKLLGEFGGAYWTDHNIHDPGITVLEQLALATADMIYRAERNPGQTIFPFENIQNTLLSAEQSFPSEAVTENDLRKIIFDQIPEARNVWVRKVEDANKIKGLYDILVDIDKSDLITTTELSIIKHKISQIFHQHRNLGEDLKHVIILEHLPINLSGQIEIEDHYQTETVLANIYAQIELFIRPKMTYYHSKGDNGHGLNLAQKLNGPLLKNGIILDKQLKPKLNRILSSEIMKIILDTVGVKRLKNFKIESNKTVFVDQIDIQGNVKPTLTLPLQTEDYKLQVKKQNEGYTPIDFATFFRKYKEKSSLIPPTPNTTTKEVERAEKKEDLAFYHSIQHDFPSVYRLGEDGIGANAPQYKKDTVLQLKGYLLLLEQLMANFFGQLEHVNKLYSYSDIDNSTYNFIPMKGIPLFEELIQGANQDQYPLLLKKLGETIDNRQLRKSRFLDYLLNIYGEEVPNYLDHTSEFIGKKNLFKHLKEIQLNKNKGCKTVDQTYIPAGIIQKVNHFFNLNSQALVCMNDYCITSDKEVKLESLKMPIHTDVDFIDEDDLIEVNIDPKFRLKNQDIPDWVLQSGKDLSNYLLNFKDGKVVYLQHHQTKKIYKLAVLRNKKDAINYIYNSQHLLNHLNKISNSISMIEHIHLRPQSGEENFGIILKDENDKNALASVNTYSIENRSKAKDHIYDSLKVSSNFKVINNGDQTFSISFKDPNHDIEFEGIKKEISVEIAHQQLDRIVYYFKHVSKHVFEKKIINYFFQYQNGKRVNEQAINYSCTAFFPLWPSPISQSSYQEKIINYIYEHKPAYVSIYFKGLIYQDWIIYMKEKNNMLFSENNATKQSARQALTNLVFN